MHRKSTSNQPDSGQQGASVRICRPLSLPGVEVIETADARRSHREYVDCFAVWCVSQGTSRSRVGNRSFEIRSGATVVLAPGELLVAAPIPTVAVTASMLRIHSDAFERWVPTHGGLATHVLPSQSLSRSVHDAVRRFVDAVLQPEDAPRVSELSRLFEDVRGALLTSVDRNAKRGSHSGRLQRVRDLLHHRFADALSLSDMANECRMSRESLVRKFHLAYGAPPHQYLMHVRVARARTLLARGTSATETAFACGFSDQSHLNRWFKKALGMTPGHYAKAFW